jgi:dGTPase
VLATFTKYPRPSHLDNRTRWQERQEIRLLPAGCRQFPASGAVDRLVERIPGTAWRRHPLAFLVEVADDTCYLIVDLEDAARLGFVPYKDAECLLADLAGNAVSGRRLDRLHDPKERLEYLRAKAIGRLLESAAAVFLENEDAILSGEFDDELLEQSPVAVPLQAILRLAKETIYTARPALEIETAGFEVLGACLACLPMPSRRGPGRRGSRPANACCSSCCRPSSSAMAASRMPIPTFACCRSPILSPG